MEKRFKLGALKFIPNYTYKDYINWDGRWELIDGIAYAMAPMPTLKHQRISNNISWQLNEKLRNCKKCKAYLPIDWKVSEDTILQPDNLVLCYTPRNQKYITKAPSIIFEILSPSTKEKDKFVKYSIYEREKVKYYIIIDPEEEMAEIYKLNNNRYTLIAKTKKDIVKFEIDCEFEFDFSLIWD